MDLLLGRKRRKEATAKLGSSFNAIGLVSAVTIAAVMAVARWLVVSGCILVRCSRTHHDIDG